VLVDATRVNEYLTNFIKTLRSGIDENEVWEELKCCKISFKNAPTKLNYKEDSTWQELKDKLAEREELLKLAEKSKEPIYDSEAAQVPKVSRIKSGRVININY
jgi:hypothetical protein